MLSQFRNDRVYDHLVLRSKNRFWLPNERVLEVVDEIGLATSVLQDPEMIGSQFARTHNRAPQNQATAGESLWWRRKSGLSQARIPSRAKLRAMRIDNGQLDGTITRRTWSGGSPPPLNSVRPTVNRAERRVTTCLPSPQRER